MLTLWLLFMFATLAAVGARLGVLGYPAAGDLFFLVGFMFGFGAVVVEARRYMLERDQ